MPHLLKTRISLPVRLSLVGSVLSATLLTYADPPAPANSANPSPDAAPSITASTPSSTNPPVSSLPPMVVTASRTEESVTNIPQTVTVLDSQEVRERQANTPAEMLEGQPGIWTNNVAAQGSPILRGQIGNRVLYLWDGIRINNGALFAGPNGYFNEFPVGAVDRMEVLHGSGAVQYGSDAIGGVINIIPIHAQFTDGLDIGGDIYSRYDSNTNGTTETLNYHISDKNVAFAVGVTRQDIGDYYGPGYGHIPNTSFNAMGGYADLALKLDDNQVLRISAIINDRGDIHSYVQSELNPNGVPRIYSPYETRGIGKIDYTAKDLGAWSSEFKIYAYYQGFLSDRERRVQSATDFTDTSTYTDQKVAGLGVQNITTIDKLRLIYGSDYRKEYLSSYLLQSDLNYANDLTTYGYPAGNTPNGTYAAFDVFATAEYRPVESLLLTLGGRYENSHIDSHPVANDVIPNAGYSLNTLYLNHVWNSFTWDVGLVYSVTHSWDMTATVSTGFRAPTYSDLFSAGPPVFSSLLASVPSPYLDPERSVTYEVGQRYHDDTLTASLSGYLTELRDVVVQSVSGTVTIPGQGVYAASHNTNDGKGYVTGVEFAASYKIAHNWTLFANATYTYGEDTSADAPLRFIPPLNGMAGLRYDSPSGRWWVELEEVWAAALSRHAPQDELDAGFSTDPGLGSPNATTNKPLPNYEISGWAITNLRSGFNVWKNNKQSFDVTIGLENIFNKAYREAYSQQEIVAPGFGVVVGARLTF